MAGMLRVRALQLHARRLSASYLEDYSAASHGVHNHAMFVGAGSDM